jgi:hypothetical protein
LLQSRGSIGTSSQDAYKNYVVLSASGYNLTTLATISRLFLLTSISSEAASGGGSSIDNSTVTNTNQQINNRNISKYPYTNISRYTAPHLDVITVININNIINTFFIFSCTSDVFVSAHQLYYANFPSNYSSTNFYTNSASDKLITSETIFSQYS